MLTFVLSCLLFSFSSWGFNLTKDFTQGIYWAKLPLSISVSEEAQNLKSTLEKLAQDAIGEWEARTGLSIWSLDSGSKNIIRWSTDFANQRMQNLPNYWLRLCLMSCLMTLN